MKSFKYLLGERAYVGIECGGFSKASLRFALQKFQRKFCIARSTHPTLRWLNEIRGIMQSL